MRDLKVLEKWLSSVKPHSADAITGETPRAIISAAFDTLTLIRQYRIILTVQMRQRIFRQTKQKSAGRVTPLSRIFVTYDGKDASRCAVKAQAANCAVLP